MDKYTVVSSNVNCKQQRGNGVGIFSSLSLLEKNGDKENEYNIIVLLILEITHCKLVLNLNPLSSYEIVNSIASR